MIIYSFGTYSVTEVWAFSLCSIAPASIILHFLNYDFNFSTIYKTIHSCARRAADGIIILYCSTFFLSVVS